MTKYIISKNWCPEMKNMPNKIKDVMMHVYEAVHKNT